MYEDVNMHGAVERSAASILYSDLHIAQCYMSADSSCISNCAGVHTCIECCYKTVNCEELIYCSAPTFMQFGLLHSME